jgi:hypothetical protein
MWKVYKLTNSALSECFAGITQGEPQECLREAADGEIEIIDYWDGEEHRITLEVLKEVPSEASAAEFLAGIIAKDGCVKAP